MVSSRSRSAPRKTWSFSIRTNLLSWPCGNGALDDRHRRQTYFGSGGLSRARPTAGRQAFRAIAYGLIIITVAGVPLAWQFSDDNTKDMVRGWGISPAGLSSIFGVKSFPVAAQTVSKIPDRASTQDAPSPQGARRSNCTFTGRGRIICRNATPI